MKNKVFSSITDELIDKIMTSDPLQNAEVITLAVQGIIDYFACVLQARKNIESKKLLNTIKAEGGHKQIWLIGQNAWATPKQAALFNGFQAHLLDYDDVHVDVRGHPSAVILSALLSSLNDTTTVLTPRFIAAYIVGIELMAHLGIAIGSAHYLKGWHNTATLGGIAATAAVCYLHHYNFIKEALLIAATQSSGLRVVFGTTVKPLHAGMAAQIAIQSCQWAQAGIEASADFLDDNKGFLTVYGEGNQAFNITNWGNPWRLQQPGLWFKNYSYCSAASYVADAAVKLRAEHNFKIHDINNIRLIFSPKSDDALIYQQVSSHKQGQFSAEYIVASILLNRTLTFSTFTREKIDEDLKQLMLKIERTYANITAERFAQVDILLKTNQLLSQVITNPKGSPSNSYSSDELKFKFFKAINDENIARNAYEILLKFNQNIPVHCLITRFIKLFYKLNG